MSHVLIGGEEQQMVELRFLLVKWGVTVGPLPLGDNVPTVLDCDAVILQGDFDEYRGACLGTLPDGPGGAVGPAAPLIFINSEGVSLASVPDYWLALDAVDDDGGNLWLALQTSVASARALRGESNHPASENNHQQADTYLHFLGHELRSPLTAIKTSLEVLEGELGGLDAQRKSGSALKMLNIALRNVRRLHKTVDWSQDLLAASSLPRTISLREVAVDEMVARLQELGEVRVDAKIQGLDFQTDPEVLTSLLTQMARAAGMACPDTPLTIQINADHEDDRLMHLAVSAGDGEQEAVSVTSHRTRLVSAEDQGDPLSELDRLARFMVSPGLVQSLGATLRTTDSADEQTALVLTVEMLPETLTSL